MAFMPRLLCASDGSGGERRNGLKNNVKIIPDNDPLSLFQYLLTNVLNPAQVLHEFGDMVLNRLAGSDYILAR